MNSKRVSTMKKILRKSLADVLMYTISICLDRDYDIEAIINDKIDEVMKREY
ncbi:hypothetical protein MX850_12185 [Erysipelothrix sp. Poltava]|nr:hypothetical protein MX850_12185 [Erysipelothrix sp. Poltava]